MVTRIVNFLIDILVVILNWLISLLPDSPFSTPSSPPDSVNLGYITWIFDFPTWLAHLALIISAILIYYGIRVAARWIKMVRS